MNNKKAFLGVLAGVAAGAVLGVLLAPDKGSHTRKDVRKKGEDLADALGNRIDEKFDDLIDALTGRMKKSKTEATEQTVKTE